jgi:hypothetical protein
MFAYMSMDAIEAIDKAIPFVALFTDFTRVSYYHNFVYEKRGALRSVKVSTSMYGLTR